MAVAIFDEDIPITIDAQIYTAYKSNWCALNPTLKTFSEGHVYSLKKTALSDLPKGYLEYLESLGLVRPYV